MLLNNSHNVAMSWIGVAAAGAFFISLIGAMGAADGWTFAKDPVEALAVGDSAAYFNYGCCAITGILALIFGIVSAFSAKNGSGAAAGVLIFASGLCLVQYGIITNSVDANIHEMAGYLCLLFGVCAAVAACHSFWIAGDHLFVALPVIFMFALIAVYIDGGCVAFQSWYGVLASMAIIDIAVGKMLTTPKTEA